MIYILLIAHFLADFTFQSAKLAQRKVDSFKCLVIHSLIYGGAYFAVFLAFIGTSYITFPYIIIIIFHFLIDWIRIWLEKRVANRTVVFAAFIIDQIAHILVIVFTYIIFNLEAKINYIYVQMMQWTDFEKIIAYTLIFVIIWDPAAVFIKKLFSYLVDQQDNSLDDNSAQIGRIIGKLERVIIVILVLCSQFGAIGFVLAAKSIARYKQLEDKDFAERYLVGTLASAAIAFIITIVLKN